MKNRYRWAAVMLALFLILPALLQAQAFKDSENDPLFFLRTLPRPNMLIIADTSGSMMASVFTNHYDPASVRDTSLSYYSNAYPFDADHPDSRMKNLKNALQAIVTGVSGINFGLGRFNNWTTYYYYIGNYRHTFASDRYLYQYCHEQDYHDGQGLDTSNCIYLDRCYRAGYQYGGSATASSCSTSAYYSVFLPNTDYPASSDQEMLRYRYRTRITAHVGDTYDIYTRNYRQYDPRDEDPPFPGGGDELTSWTTTVSYDGSSYTVTMDPSDVYVYSGQWSYGLYMPYVDSLPHVNVDIRNDYDDDPLTPEDEADNTAALLAATGHWIEKGAFIPGGSTPLDASLYDAKIYFRDNIIPRDDVDLEVKECRDNYVILITDGQSSDGAFYDKSRDLYNELGIQTFGIALALGATSEIDQASDYGDDGMGNGTAESYKCNNTEELVEAIKDIVAHISDELDSLAPPVVSTIYTHPYWDTSPEYAGDNDASEAIMVQPFFQYPSWRGHLLATWLYYIEYNPRIPDDPGTPGDERWITYNFNPYDLWTAGYILSREDAPLVDTNADTYLNEEDNLVTNSGYKAADDRVIYTSRVSGGTISLVPFNTSLVNKVERLGLLEPDIPPVILNAWNADKNRRQYQDDDECADVIINYIRGKKPKVDQTDIDSDGNRKDWQRDPMSGEIIYQERDWKLGDSVYSVPAIVGTPSGLYKKKFFSEEYINPGEQEFDEFAEEYENRPSIVLFGTNDGVLHCFALEDISTSETFGPGGMYAPSRDYIAGEEIWAFLPGDNDIMHKLKWLLMDYGGDGEADGQLYEKRQSWRDPSGYEWIHWYYMDGPVRYSNVFIDTDADGNREWKTVAMIGEGRGGRYYYTLDITNPFDPQLMWKFPDDADSSNMGVTVSTPAIAHQLVPGTGEYRWIAIFGAGYDAEHDSTNDVGQYIYALDLVDGSVAYEFDEPALADSASSKKALVIASPAVFNSGIGLDYTDDKVFIGDTDGKLWRIDLHVEDPAEMVHLRLDFNDEDQAIIAPVSAAHASGESVWWDLVFLGTGGDTRVTSEKRHRLVGFVDESFSVPYAPDYPTIAPYASDDNYLPPPIEVDADFASFTPTKLVFMHLLQDDYERNDAQPTTNIMETAEYTRLQTFFTLFNPGDDPCVIGTSRLVEVDHLIDKVSDTLNRVELPAGGRAASLDLGTGKSGGTYVSDGVVFAPSGNKVNIFGQPVPPPPPKGNKIVVNVLSWKVISD